MTIEELNIMSDHELIQVEDQMLLEREVDAHMRVKHTGGRFIILVLSIVIWLVLKSIFIRLTLSIAPETKGIVSFVLFFITMGLSVVISHFVWKLLGVTARFWLRNALHYWPVTFYFLIGIFVLIKS